MEEQRRALEQKKQADLDAKKKMIEDQRKAAEDAVRAKKEAEERDYWQHWWQQPGNDYDLYCDLYDGSYG